MIHHLQSRLGLAIIAAGLATSLPALAAAAPRDDRSGTEIADQILAGIRMADDHIRRIDDDDGRRYAADDRGRRSKNDDRGRGRASDDGPGHEAGDDHGRRGKKDGRGRGRGSDD